MTCNGKIAGDWGYVIDRDMPLRTGYTFVGIGDKTLPTDGFYDEHDNWILLHESDVGQIVTADWSPMFRPLATVNLRRDVTAGDAGYASRQGIHAGEGFEFFLVGEIIPPGLQVEYFDTRWLPWTLSDSTYEIHKHTLPLRRRTKKLDEHARMMFFFFNRYPTDPSLLPPPPKQRGITNDSIWDE